MKLDAIGPLLELQIAMPNRAHTHTRVESNLVSREPNSKRTLPWSVARRSTEAPSLGGNSYS